MADPIRMHRVKAFCDWLDTVPPQPPFHTRPEFRFYADLTDDELEAADQEMHRRSEWAGTQARRFQQEREHRRIARSGVPITSGRPNDDGPEAA